MISAVVSRRSRSSGFRSLMCALSVVLLPTTSMGGNRLRLQQKNKSLQCVSSGSPGLLPRRSALLLKRSQEGLDRERLKLMDEGRCSSGVDVRRSKGIYQNETDLVSARCIRRDPSDNRRPIF